MKVFISWSGKPSELYAQRICDYLKRVLQSVDPFVSTYMLRSGERWAEKLQKELEIANFGIACVTPDNYLSPWMHFEAGAVGKSSQGGVAVLRFDEISNETLNDTPLGQFQSKLFDATEFKSLIMDINRIAPKVLENDVINDLFDTTWPALDRQIREDREVIADKENSINPSDLLTQGSMEIVASMLSELSGEVYKLRTDLEYYRQEVSRGRPGDEGTMNFRNLGGGLSSRSSSTSVSTADNPNCQ